PNWQRHPYLAAGRPNRRLLGAENSRTSLWLPSRDGSPGRGGGPRPGGSVPPRLAGAVAGAVSAHSDPWCSGGLPAGVRPAGNAGRFPSARAVASDPGTIWLELQGLFAGAL